MDDAISKAESRPVTLKVHLGGAIAFVPDGNTFWALMPHALIPTPARWREEGRRLNARSPHMPLLIVNEDSLIDKNVPRIIYRAANLRDVNNCSAFPMNSGEKAALTLLDDELIFTKSGDGVCCYNEVRDFAPQMREISKSHRFASYEHCHPNGDKFKTSQRVSAAFHLHSGALSVGGYFASKQIVNFGYVSWPLSLLKPVWKREVANYLVWTLTYPPCDEITFQRRPFTEPNPDRTFRLKVPGTGQVDIAILHAEPELPFLFLRDPKLPDNFARFPDPDFEVFYSLSTRKSRCLPWRVPISPGGPAGGEEKTCANGFFEGFR